MFARHPFYPSREEVRSRAEIDRGIRIPPERTYRLTPGIHEMICAAGLSPAAVRLLHVLLHEAGQVYDHAYLRRRPRQLRLACIEVRQRLGVLRANDNRAIQLALAELARAPHLVTARLLDGRRVIEWSFSDAILSELLDESLIYGLFDIEDLPALRSATALWLHSKMGLVWRMRCPRIDFAVEQLFNETGDESTPSWSTMRDAFLGCLEDFARREDARFIVSCAWEYRLSGIDHIHMHIEHEQTQWHVRGLRKVRPRTRKVFLIDRGGCVQISPHSLCEIDRFHVRSS